MASRASAGSGTAQLMPPYRPTPPPPTKNSNYVVCVGVWGCACVWGCIYRYIIQWRIQGGSRGSGPPPFGPRCRLFNIGPKVGPPPFVNVQEWGCFSNFLRSDDVTRTMSKGGCACEKSCIRAWTPPPSKILDPRLV